MLLSLSFGGKFGDMLSAESSFFIISMFATHVWKCSSRSIRIIVLSNASVVADSEPTQLVSSRCHREYRTCVRSSSILLALTGDGGIYYGNRYVHMMI